MSIIIQSATYGIPDQLTDVTARVQLMVRDSNGQVVINNNTMGGDPAFGHPKQLYVLYIGKDGHTQAAQGSEGSTIVLVDEPQGAPVLAPWGM